MNKMRSSSVAPDLKLKLELQADDGDRQQGSGVVNCLELRLGISSVDNGSSSWQVDPWSLAARQEKAHQRPDECDIQRENNRPAAAASAPAQAVGWPPVRAFRKNLSSAAKPADAADDAPLLSKEKLGSEDGDGGGGERRPMFVKVNLEGCAVGRKVDLQAHRGYGSLSRALQSMFLLSSDGQWRIAAAAAASSDKDEDNEQQQVETKKKKTSYILLYEDNEGDRMLVGDVPWELFVASVKRLYIAQDTRTTR